MAYCFRQAIPSFQCTSIRKRSNAFVHVSNKTMRKESTGSKWLMPTKTLPIAIPFTKIWNKKHGQNRYRPYPERKKIYVSVTWEFSNPVWLKSRIEKSEWNTWAQGQKPPNRGIWNREQSVGASFIALGGFLPKWFLWEKDGFLIYLFIYCACCLFGLVFPKGQNRGGSQNFVVSEFGCSDFIPPANN